jgi:hypothetical protein
MPLTSDYDEEDNQQKDDLNKNLQHLNQHN